MRSPCRDSRAQHGFDDGCSPALTPNERVSTQRSLPAYRYLMASNTPKEFEKIYIGDVHVANIREENGHGDRPFIVESVNGKVLKELADRHAAELWISVHSDDITERDLG